jgi:hypothetical protein
VAVHDKFVALAKRLIEKHGRLVTLRKISETPNDTDKPWRGNDDDTSASDDISITAKTLMKGLFYEDSPDNEVRRAVQDAVVAAASAVDTNGAQVDLKGFDQLIDGDIVWKIDKVQEVKPGDLVILWKLRLKQ